MSLTMMYKQLLHVNATMLFILIIGLYAGMADAHGNVSLEQDSFVCEGHREARFI